MMIEAPETSRTAGPTRGCPRCQSLMVQETFVDWESDTGALYFTGWRCIT